MKQSSFSDLAYEHKKKTTRKERFLAEMDAILPWDKLLKPILRKYPKAGQGRRPIPAAVMLRIYFLQQWYGLSDPGMEDSLYDVESMRRFAGVDLESIPDETTILKFRHFLEAHRLTEALFRLNPALSVGAWFAVKRGDDSGRQHHQCAEFDEEQGTPAGPGDEAGEEGDGLVFWHEDAHRHGYAGPGAQCGGDPCRGT